MSSLPLADSTIPAEPVAKAKQAATPPGRAWHRRARVWFGFAMAYLTALFVATHLPVPQQASSVMTHDKLVHAGAYFVLMTLLCVTLRRYLVRITSEPGGGRPPFAVRLLQGLAWRLALGSLVMLYAAFDEWTQPYFGRECDLGDWLADGAGVVLAIVVDVIRKGLTGR